MNTQLVAGSVVVGVDDSADGMAAVEWAAAYAEATRRPLGIVHALGHGGLVGSVAGKSQVSDVRRLVGQRVTEEALAHARKVAPHVEATLSLAEEPPVDALKDAAGDAAMLVLGTRGRGSLARSLIGSVSLALTAKSACPVVVVRRPPEGPAEQMPRGVVLAVDGTPSSSGAVEFAFALASWTGQPLEVVHALALAHHGKESLERMSGESFEERIAEGGLEVAESIAGYPERYPDVTVMQQQLTEDPVPGLLRLSEQAATIVVGASSNKNTTGLLESTTRALVEKAKCTVAVVPAKTG